MFVCVCVCLSSIRCYSFRATDAKLGTRQGVDPEKLCVKKWNSYAPYLRPCPCDLRARFFAFFPLCQVKFKPFFFDAILIKMTLATVISTGNLSRRIHEWIWHTSANDYMSTEMTRWHGVRFRWCIALIKINASDIPAYFRGSWTADSSRPN